MGVARLLRSGFALDRLSPLHRSDALRHQIVDDSASCAQALAREALQSLRASFRKPQEALAPFRERAYHPPSSRHLPAGVVEASSRARLAWGARAAASPVRSDRCLQSTRSVFNDEHLGLGSLRPTLPSLSGRPTVVRERSVSRRSPAGACRRSARRCLSYRSREGVSPGLLLPVSRRRRTLRAARPRDARTMERRSRSAA